MNSSTEARSRRSLLVAAAAAGGALATQALVRPEPASAASVTLGVVNNESTATTFRTTQATNTCLLYTSDAADE